MPRMAPPAVWGAGPPQASQGLEKPTIGRPCSNRYILIVGDEGAEAWMRAERQRCAMRRTGCAPPLLAWRPMASGPPAVQRAWGRRGGLEAHDRDRRNGTRGVLDAPIDSTACRQCAARTRLRRSACAARSCRWLKNAAAEVHSAYRDAREAEIVDLKYGMAILRTRCRVPPGPAADAGKDRNGSVAHAAAIRLLHRHRL